MTNVFVLETKRVGSGRSNFRPTHATHVANSDFEAELISKLLLTGTNLRKRVVATLSYSSEITLHPQFIYAIAFSAGLNTPSSPYVVHTFSIQGAKGI